MAETVRGGILSIDAGQKRGRESNRHEPFQTKLNVILPRRFAISSLNRQHLIINIKDTCVLSVIGSSNCFVSKSIVGANYRYC
jgi:ABC-type amino acid transport system permease subunit